MIVDNQLVPGQFATIDEMIEYSEHRQRLIVQTKDKLKNSNRPAKQKPEFKFNVVASESYHHPDASQLFTMLSASNPQLVNVQDQFRMALDFYIQLAETLQRVTK